MSHFSVLIIGDSIEDKLVPFDENLEVTPYIRRTSEDLKKERKNILEEARDLDLDFDYTEYKNMNLAEFAKAYYDADVDAENNLLSAYNPNSKWDWYQIGGRMERLLTTKSDAKVNQAPLNQLNLNKESFGTFAVITEDGRWHEMGKMGWWGFSSETKEEADEWKRTYWNRFIKGLPADTLLTIVDCHV